MLDFLFFDMDIAQRFSQQANIMGCISLLEHTPEGGIQVRIVEDHLSDAIRDELEVLYDALFFGEQAERIEQMDQDGAFACGVQIKLSTGIFTTVLLEPEIMNKLLGTFSPTEIQDLFSHIADAVEHPQACGVCHVLGQNLLS